MADNDQAVQTASSRPGLLDKFFEITHRGSTIRQEIRGGIVAFVAMAYIVVLNPLILGGSQDIAGDSLDFAQLTAVTGLVAGVAQLDVASWVAVAASWTTSSSTAPTTTRIWSWPTRATASRL